ncbi:MAG: EamA family transporter [Ruminococcaceae bacterium]|nr:EamA family transporter [Oscillospiraceae bacterium]
MNDLTANLLIIIAGVFIASFAQTLLKRSAIEKHKSSIAAFLNLKVISAYILIAASMVLSFIGLRKVPLSYTPIPESLGQIFVLLFSYLFLGESVSKKKIFGVFLILVGIIVIYL